MIGGVSKGESARLRIGRHAVADMRTIKDITF
jgi:hypothetical protein